jgi:hypothetical protein
VLCHRRKEIETKYVLKGGPDEPLPSEGLIDSTLVPKSLDELYAKQLNPIGKISASQVLDRLSQSKPSAH